MNVYSACDIGKTRHENQDCLTTERLEDGILAIVCDGMGGMDNGAEASRLAVEAAVAAFRGAYSTGLVSDAVCELLTECAAEANHAVYQVAAHGETRIRMGSTLVGAFLRDDFACLVNVGDSRAYLIRKKGSAKQLTMDHTVVQLLYERGEISAEMRAIHPRRNELTRAIGVTYRVLADTYELVLKEGEKLLLCSDGLYSHVEDDKIAEIVRTETAENVPQALVDAANQAGGRDNISVVLLTRDS